jgi:hypothetical protein
MDFGDLIIFGISEFSGARHVRSLIKLAGRSK